MTTDEEKAAKGFAVLFIMFGIPLAIGLWRWALCIVAIILLLPACDVVFGLHRDDVQDCEIACRVESDCPSAFFCSHADGLCRSGASSSTCVELDAGLDDLGVDASISRDSGACSQPATCDLIAQLGCCAGTSCYLDPDNTAGASCEATGTSTMSCSPGVQNQCAPGRVCAASHCYLACDTSKPNTCFGTQLCRVADGLNHGFCQ